MFLIHISRHPSPHHRRNKLINFLISNPIPLINIPILSLSYLKLRAHHDIINWFGYIWWFWNLPWGYYFIFLSFDTFLIYNFLSYLCILAEKCYFSFFIFCWGLFCIYRCVFFYNIQNLFFLVIFILRNYFVFCNRFNLCNFFFYYIFDFCYLVYLFNLLFHAFFL